MKSIAFIHLDLGIGGAENLVVNAAKGLSHRGYDVTIFTSYHDKSRAFKETIDGTLKVCIYIHFFEFHQVVVYGSWIPRQLFSRFTILMSIIRMIYICLCMFVANRRFDVVFSDQVSVTNIGVNLLRLAKKKSVFYCHYPDVLLCTNRGTILRRMYRWLFDWMERTTTAFCDVLVVNSQFTADQLAITFPNISKKVHVLYPPVDCCVPPKKVKVSPFFFSLNRFERKKDLPLVVQQFARADLPSFELVIAGGFDSRLQENTDVFNSLAQLVETLNLRDKVRILKNISEKDREFFLSHATAVIYSPHSEHFGIVPVEAMAVGTPVIAWNNGGPKESVVDGKTGILCNDRDEFGLAMQTIVDKKWSKNCMQRVESMFSLKSFSKQLYKIIS